MTRKILLALLLLGAAQYAGIAQSFSKTVSSPDKHIQVDIMLSDKGEPEYKITYNGKELIGKSRLGLSLRGINLSSGLKRVGDGVIDDSARNRPCPESVPRVWRGEKDHNTRG